MKKRLSPTGLAALFGALVVVFAWHFPALSSEYANPQFLTETEKLQAMLGRSDVRIVDVRSKTAYEKGHIAGAVHLSADDVVDKNSPVEGALHPLQTLISMMEKRGIAPSTQVVLYDDRGGFHAARLFWLLEYLGHRKVSVLNGGFPKWRRENLPMSRDTPDIEPAQFYTALMPRRLATADWLLDRRTDDSVVVIDVRPAKLYRAGHIPWARNIAWSSNVRRDGTLKPANVLHRHFESHGVTKDKNIAVHCQVGKAAAHSYFTLRVLGYPRVRSYDRSWAEWGAADDLPKATKRQG